MRKRGSRGRHLRLCFVLRERDDDSRQMARDRAGDVKAEHAEDDQCDDEHAKRRVVALPSMSMKMAATSGIKTANNSMRFSCLLTGASSCAGDVSVKFCASRHKPG